MAFNETDKVWIRHFGGWGAVFSQADPRLESAITGIQSIADGGSRPDSSSENYVKALLYNSSATSGTPGVTIGGAAQNVTFTTPAVRGLIQIESQIAQLDVFLGTLEADGGDVKLDTAREMIRLRMEGRRLVFSMCRMLGMRGPRIDVFSSGVTTEDNDPFWADLSPWWNG